MDVSWPLLLKKPLMPTTAFSFSRVKRDGRVVEVHLAGLDRGRRLCRDSRRIDLEAKCESGLGAHTRPDAAVLGPGDRLMEPKLSAPERLIAERVEAEDLPAPLEELLVERLGLRE